MNFFAYFFSKPYLFVTSVPNPSQQEEIEQLKARIEELERSHNQQLQSYQTQIAEKDSEINRLQEQIKQLLKLNSVRGVDYTKLRDLLAAGERKEANRETKERMVEVANRQKQGYLDVKDIDNFPCEDLRTIDQLWVHYSNGRFGFSVQKDIYLGLDGTRNYKEEIWYKFGEQVGWRKGGEWLSYSELEYKLRNTTLWGHLPIEEQCGWAWGGRGLGFSSLAYRVADCST